LTLIEVIIAMTLLATLLVTMLTAFQLHRRQLLDSSRKLQAVEQAEMLMTNWYAKRGGVPEIPSQGTCEHPSELAWRLTKLSSVAELPSAELIVAKLAIFDPAEPQNELARCELLQQIALPNQPSAPIDQ
jgi:type II secretory pathway pseudopilin PulG